MCKRITIARDRLVSNNDFRFLLVKLCFVSLETLILSADHMRFSHAIRT